MAYSDAYNPAISITERPQDFVIFMTINS
uniref:Uncharacterized protein n=1 Tax=Nelumbo nucifera TaxID=4432 RepID=A0A822ZQI6_NELNU|nr:TPA_asm: hypothetical protein HUJ06_016687 [Nelumbo nucifera]